MDIKEKIKDFPQSPGIYMMRDDKGNIIYVGKSKSLRDRIKSYFVNSDNHSRKIKRMVKNISDITITTTDTELDALILECEKIQEIKPMYNTLMKKYENYCYIKINSQKGIYIVDHIENDDYIYFGPYTMERKLEEIKNIFIEVYKLPNCQKFTKCIRYDLNKCIGPCRSIENKDLYKDILENIIKILNGKNDEILNILTKQMNDTIQCLNFEEAQRIKKNMDLMNSLFRKQQIITKAVDNKLLIGWIKLNESLVKIYLIGYGKILYSKIIDLNKINDKIKEELTLDIRDRILKEKEKTKEIIDKSSIDFINIIYNYIENNKDINYMYVDL